MAKLISALLIILVLLGLYFVGLPFAIEESKQLKAYENFCEIRPTFCYCNFVSCQFKTSWSSVNGFSNDTKELCKLAKEFEDKKTIFRVGCEE